MGNYRRFRGVNYCWRIARLGKDLYAFFRVDIRCFTVRYPRCYFIRGDISKRTAFFSVLQMLSQ